MRQIITVIGVQTNHTTPHTQTNVFILRLVFLACDTLFTLYHIYKMVHLKKQIFNYHGGKF